MNSLISCGRASRGRGKVWRKVGAGALLGILVLPHAPGNVGKGGSSTSWTGNPLVKSGYAAALSFEQQLFGRETRLEVLSRAIPCASWAPTRSGQAGGTPTYPPGAASSPLQWAPALATWKVEEPKECGGQAGSGVVHLRTIRASENTFGLIVSVVADSMGRVFVADRMNDRILVFDSLGGQVAQYGDRGDGPGEFRYLTSIGLQGDDLVAEDQRLGRLTVWSGKGDVTTREWPGRSLGVPEGFLRSATGLYVVGRSTRGPARIITHPPSASGKNSYPRPAVRYALFHLQGPLAVLKTLRDTAVDAEGPICEAGGHILGLMPFFPTGPLRAFLPGHRFAMASTKEFRIDVVDVDTGDTARTIIEDYPPAPVTDRLWERATQGFRENEARYGVYRNCRLKELRPSIRPPIRAIFSDDSGRLWAEVPTPRGFDAVVFKNGRLIARFPFPQRDPSVAPFVSKGRLYVVAADSLGLQSVEVYSVHIYSTSLK